MSKQDTVVQMVKAGEHTREEILEAADCTKGALASYFSAMRNAAKYTGEAICPIEIDGIFCVKTFDEVDQIKSERVVNRKPAKTPEQLYEAAKKAVPKADKALTGALQRLDKDDCELNELLVQKARTEVHIANLKLDQMAVPEDQAEDELL